MAAGLLLAACGDDAGERAAKVRRQQFIADSLALKVAVTPTLDCLPLYLAEQEGWFEREGVSVQLRPYTAQMDQDTALLRQRQVEQFLKVYQMACDTLAARGMKPYRELIAATCYVRPETADSLPAFSFRPSLSSTPQSKNAQPTNPKH